MGVLLLAALLFSPVACENEAEPDPPDLPPVESLMMDFSAFEEVPPHQKTAENSYGNFLYSYLTVAYWNISATLVSVLPVAAYGHMLQLKPEYLGDHSWEWGKEFQLDAKNYTAKLLGTRLDNETFSMEMWITPSDQAEQGVKWFDGVIRYDHTHASWKLYRNGSIPVLEIEWNKDYETHETDLRYTICEAGHEQEDSYIMWSFKPGEVYDASYDVSLAAGMTNMLWNHSTLEGRVKSPVQFGDESWHCWDSRENGFRDINCQSGN